MGHAGGEPPHRGQLLLPDRRLPRLRQGPIRLLEGGHLFFHRPAFLRKPRAHPVEGDTEATEHGPFLGDQRCLAPHTIGRRQEPVRRLRHRPRQREIEEDEDEERVENSEPDPEAEDRPDPFGAGAGLEPLDLEPAGFGPGLELRPGGSKPGSADRVSVDYPRRDRQTIREAGELAPFTRPPVGLDHTRPDQARGDRLRKQRRVRPRLLRGHTPDRRHQDRHRQHRSQDARRRREPRELRPERKAGR